MITSLPKLTLGRGLLIVNGMTKRPHVGQFQGRLNSALEYAGSLQCGQIADGIDSPLSSISFIFFFIPYHVNPNAQVQGLHARCFTP